MPRPKSLIPAYLLHKPTGQARVRINGKDFYLGPYGSDESRRKYGELIASPIGTRRSNSTQCCEHCACDDSQRPEASPPCDNG